MNGRFQGCPPPACTAGMSWLAAIPIWVLRVRCPPLPKAQASLGKVDDGNGDDERPEPSVGHAGKPIKMQRGPKQTEEG